MKLDDAERFIHGLIRALRSATIDDARRMIDDADDKINSAEAAWSKKKDDRAAYILGAIDSIRRHRWVIDQINPWAGS